MSACAPRYYERDGYYRDGDRYNDRHYSDNPSHEYRGRRYNRNDD